MLTVQLETPGAGFVELSREALAGYARALGVAWSALGVQAGDRVVIYDYGSSPMAYLASRTFTPYLAQGAAELTGSLALCVDGLPDNVQRLAHVLRHFKPRFLFVRWQLVPLLLGGPTAIAEQQRAARLVVGCDADGLAPSERAVWEERWPGGVSVMCGQEPDAACPCGSWWVR